MKKKELKDILNEVEWYQAISNCAPSCPYCGNMKHWGHSKDCALKKAITIKQIYKG